MTDPAQNCGICPVQTFRTQEAEGYVIPEPITLSPVDSACQQVSSCLSHWFTVPQGKPASIDYPQANITLYQNGKNQPFASCLVIWQACHVMTQRPYQHWQPAGEFMTYEYESRAGRLIYRLPRHAVKNMDTRVVLIHLFFAACATQKARPWEEEMVINDRIIAEFLGLNQRKDINRVKKLLLIESLVRQACELQVEIHWQQKGRIKAIHLPAEPLWFARPAYHIAKAEDGFHYLSGLSFRMLAGRWSTYFLNQQQARSKTAYYQYGWLPMSLPPKIMYLWQRHEGAVVMLLHFLFRLRVGQDRSAKIATLLKLIYGEESLQIAWYKSDVRRKLITSFEADLEQLFYYGIKPLFENSTYPESIQPWWVRAQDLPDDPEEALNYWTEVAQEEKTTVNSKQKWSQLLNAAITIREFPEDWQAETPKKEIRPRTNRKSTPAHSVTGAMIKRARLQQGISQRQLSTLLNKSQSWIRDIELGRYKIKPKDVQLLASVLVDLPHS